MTEIIIALISVCIGYGAHSLLYGRKIEAAQQEAQTIKEQTEEILTRYDILTENLAASVTIRDENNAIAYCSPYTEVLTGYSLDEIYDTDEDFFLTIVHEDDKARYLRALHVITSGEPFQVRYRFFHKSGLEMWAETRTVPLVDEQGNVLSSLSITLDVTGTIRYQRQVEEKNQDLQDFTYMVTHDLKSPIYTIKGMHNVIEEDCANTLPTEAKEPLEHIKQAVSRLESLISSVLEYSQISSTDITLEKVSLIEVIEQVSQDFAHKLKKCNGVMHLPTSNEFVLGDKLKIYQILSNLVGNAIKYRSLKRDLVIDLKIESALEDRYAELTITDNGQGIIAEKITNIFRPFQRALNTDLANSPEGSGIGLACVQKLTDKLGGEIAVESTLGTGSTFTLKLKVFR